MQKPTYTQLSDECVNALSSAFGQEISISRLTEGEGVTLSSIVTEKGIKPKDEIPMPAGMGNLPFASLRIQTKYYCMDKLMHALTGGRWKLDEAKQEDRLEESQRFLDYYVKTGEVRLPEGFDLKTKLDEIIQGVSQLHYGASLEEITAKYSAVGDLGSIDFEDVKAAFYTALKPYVTEDEQVDIQRQSIQKRFGAADNLAILGDAWLRERLIADFVPGLVTNKVLSKELQDFIVDTLQEAHINQQNPEPEPPYDWFGKDEDLDVDDYLVREDFNPDETTIRKMLEDCYEAAAIALGKSKGGRAIG